MKSSGVFMLAALAVSSLSAAVSLPRYFSSNMVLQRDRELAVFGRAEPGEKVAVTLGEATNPSPQARDATADKSGRWAVTFAPFPASLAAHTLSVNTLVLTNIVIGDVYVLTGVGAVGGEARRSKDPDVKELLAKAETETRVRLVTVGGDRANAPSPRAAYDPKFIARGGEWRLPAKDRPYLPLVAFRHALAQLEEDANVPVGVIVLAMQGWGLDSFLDPDVVRTTPGLEEISVKIDSYLPETPKGAEALTEFLENFESWYRQTAQALADGESSTLGPAPVYPQLKESAWSYEFFGRIQPWCGFTVKEVDFYHDMQLEGRDAIRLKGPERLKAIEATLGKVFKAPVVTRVLEKRGGAK